MGWFTTAEVPSPQELKIAIVTAGQQLSQAFLDRSVSEWRHHL